MAIAIETPALKKLTEQPVEFQEAVRARILQVKAEMETAVDHYAMQFFTAGAWAEFKRREEVLTRFDYTLSSDLDFAPALGPLTPKAP